MLYKGIQYSVVPTAEPDVWRWQFRIGDTVRTGKTQTRLEAMAARRVQAKIDATLRSSATPSADQDANRAEHPEVTDDLIR